MGSLGYRTSATELESKFINILSAVEKKKGSWRGKAKVCESLYKKANADLKEAVKLRLNGTDIDIHVFLQALIYAHIMGYICKLGQELSLINEQVVKLEQSIEKLNLKLK